MLPLVLASCGGLVVEVRVTRAEGKNRKRVAAKPGLEVVVTDHAQDRILSEPAAEPRMSAGPDQGLEGPLGLAEPESGCRISTCTTG